MLKSNQPTNQSVNPREHVVQNQLEGSFLTFPQLDASTGLSHMSQLKADMQSDSVNLALHPGKDLEALGCVECGQDEHWTGGQSSQWLAAVTSPKLPGPMCGHEVRSRMGRAHWVLGSMLWDTLFAPPFYPGPLLLCYPMGTS